MKPTFYLFDDEASPPVIGHYSHLVELPNGQLLLSGQKAWKDSTGALVDGGISEQTAAVLANIKNLLNSVGCDYSAITRISCHLANIEDYAKFNEVYASILRDHRPVRTVLGGYRLRGGALVELVAEGYRNPDERR